MKKKFWIAILIILATAGVAFAVYYIWFADHKEYVEPEMLEPEVFHDIEFDEDLLIGLWKEEENYYRYNDDGTAVTWDLADDVMEDEGTELTWTLENDTFTHYYQIEIGGVIPKMFTMKVLELDFMEYEDDYGVNHKFNKVEELQLIN
jgi:Predicted membrane protein